MAREVTLLNHGVIRCERRWCDDVDQAALGGDRDIGDGGTGTVKSRMPSRWPTSDHKIAGQLDAVGGQARQHAGVLAQQLGTGRLQRTGKHRPRRSEMTRVSARPIRRRLRNDQAHLGHCCTSPRRIAAAGCSGNDRAPALVMPG